MSEPGDPGSARGTILAVVAVILLAVGGWWLAAHMRAASRMQDCVMAGRTNCAPIP